MHTLEPELRTLRDEGLIDDATAAAALARERRDVFSLHAEVRAVLYAGVLLFMAGTGLVLSRHLDRIGPLAIVLAIAVAAAVCAVPAVRAKLAGRPPSVAGDYLLLLAALLAAADLGYAEHAFGLLGPLWAWHLLLLALAHAVVAYAFASPLVLAASLAALAGWFGLGTTPGAGLAAALHVSHSTPALGARALACAAVIVLWHQLDRRLRPGTQFGAVFEHFGGNLAFWGTIAWCLEWPWLAAGLPLLAALGALAIRRGLATGRESYLVYGVVYGAIGLCVVVIPRLGDVATSLSFLLVVVSGAAAALLQLRRRLRESAP